MLRILIVYGFEVVIGCGGREKYRCMPAISPDDISLMKIYFSMSVSGL
jgi:hypothetical protein